MDEDDIIETQQQSPEQGKVTLKMPHQKVVSQWSGTDYPGTAQR